MAHYPRCGSRCSVVRDPSALRYHLRGKMDIDVDGFVFDPVVYAIRTSGTTNHLIIVVPRTSFPRSVPVSSDSASPP